MNKEIISVIDFGSSKITVLTGVGDVNKSFKLLASSDCEYDGFASGVFVSPNDLKGVISNAINDVENQLNFKIRNIYIGVPSEFCFVYDNLITRVFNKKTKITTKIIDNIFVEDTLDQSFPTHALINKSPLYYIVNGENRTNNPVDMLALKLQCRIGYVLVENQFKSIISNIMNSLGIKDYDFISNTLAEGIYLIGEQKRSESAILVDCGYITTSVSQVLGDGLVELKSFSLGGGFITSDLSRAFEITFDEAEEIKRQAIITLKPSGVDYYQTISGKKLSVKNVNEIILNRLDKIVDIINKCISAFQTELPSYIPMYITGGGLNYIDGISDYLRQKFDRPIELVSPRNLLYRKPDLSSSISLLNMAINI